MDKRLLLLVLLIALPYSVSGEGTDFWGYFQGDTSGIETGSGNATGSFLALAIDHHGTLNFSPPEFTMAGGSIQMEADSSLAMDGGFTGVSTEPSTERMDLSGYVVEGIENRQWHSLTVVTLSHSTVLTTESKCKDLHSSEHPFIMTPAYVNVHRDRDKANTEQSIRLEECTGTQSNLIIKGDFVLSLWEWDVSVTSPDGERTTERSGQSPVEGGASALYPHASERRQIWFFVEDGELEIPYWENALLFIDDFVAEAENATLDSPSGGLRMDEDLIQIEGEQMGLSGNFTLDVQASGQSLSARAAGSFAEVQVDGETLEPAQLPAREGTWAFPVLGWIALIAAVVLVLTGTVAWFTSPKLRSAVLDPIERRRDVIFEDALAEAIVHNRGRPRKGKKWVRLAMRLRPNHPEAIAAMGNLLFHMKKYRKALGCFQKAIVNMHTIHRPSEISDDAVAFWAVECARCLAGMRLIGPREKREEISEEILDYARMAAKVDPGVAELLLTEKYISDLWGPIRMAVNMEDYGVKP